ncbi:uncharacterized protein LOC115776598 [Archocentrus centrarchus]|uniref:uncharacterized protein LOC115776598 n=1 Tax=Archocentrus centrarchus TaxID=63155 RepID=UPI0011E9D685|nr:uncharacterized protein LOC115776598 [Archocentrus centrarchus]
MSSVVVFLSLPIFVASALQEVKVRPGQDATLQCQDPRGVNMTLLEWSRPELLSDGYVFFFQNQRSYENYQHDFFRGRVELRDPSMKDGDVSVIVRNVSISDTGTYECLITTTSTRGGQRVLKEFKHSINLTVTDSGFTDENTEERGEEARGEKDGGVKDKSVLVAVTVSVLAVLLLAVIVTVAIKICRRNASKPKSDQRDEKQV